MDDFEKSLNHVLVDTFNIILKYEDFSLKKTINAPVTITEAHMIEVIGAEDNTETTVSDIASLMGISMPTATVAIKKLERKGFVSKSPCANDGRRILIALTDPGRKIERAHRLFHARMVRDISSQFHGVQKDVLFLAITKLNEYFKNKIEAIV